MYLFGANRLPQSSAIGSSYSGIAAAARGQCGAGWGAGGSTERGGPPVGEGLKALRSVAHIVVLTGQPEITCIHIDQVDRFPALDERKVILQHRLRGGVTQPGEVQFIHLQLYDWLENLWRRHAVQH